MQLASMVLPLEGGSPSSVMVIVFKDAVMLIYGDCSDEGFFKVDKGHCRRFTFQQYPALRGLRQADGSIHLAKFAALIPMGEWL